MLLTLGYETEQSTFPFTNFLFHLFEKLIYGCHCE